MKSFFKSAAAFSILSVAAALPAIAQQAAPAPGAAMPMQGMTMPVKPGATPTEGSMMSAMDRMSKDMAAVPMTGDADRDFVGMMLPHHQGAVDMAKFELAHGKDPAMLKLARGIVAAQNKEIAEMKAWQAKHPVGR
jgi:uncharacterized protein (DUF305 family)